MKLFDLHSDTLSVIFDDDISLSSSQLAVNIDALSRIDKAVQQFAVFIRDNEINPLERYKKVLKNGKRELFINGINVITKASQFVECKKISALLSVENAGFIDDASFVDELYKDGIVTASLTWNGDNRLAGGTLGKANLSYLGKEVISRMNLFSMAVDLSHLNRKSFYEVLRAARFVCATHSGVDMLLRHKRNLDDDQLISIKEKNGVVGICFYPEFVGEDAVCGFLNAVGYCLKLGMENNISIGSDFDGALMSEKLQTTADTVLLYKKTKMRFGKTIADKIFFQNALNFYHKVLTNRTL